MIKDTLLLLLCVVKINRPVSGRKRVCSLFLGKNKEVLNAELWAVSEALYIAKKTVNMVNRPVTIFVTHQKRLRHPHFFPYVKETGFYEVSYTRMPKSFNKMDILPPLNGFQVIQA